MEDREQDLLFLKKASLNQLGYFIKPEHLFSSLIYKAKNQMINGKYALILGDLESALDDIQEQHEFKDLFGDLDLNSLRLGKDLDARNEVIVNVLLALNEVDLALEQIEKDVLGDAYEYLISQFASSAGKKAGEFYTPQEVSKILAKIVTTGKTKLKSVYDPTCGSGSLLLRVAKELPNKSVNTYYGQEMNRTTYNLARMNMFIHGVRYDRLSIEQDDTLQNPMHLDKKFEAIVANPPFSIQWNPDSPKIKNDERFDGYGKFAPSSKADFAFVQHMIYHLNDDNGIMATVLPHGVLFRGASEEHIRKHIIDKNWLDAVIGLPANIFYGAGIPTCILVVRKNRKSDEHVLFIDASHEFEKAKTQNRLRNCDIEKIIDVYRNRKEIEKYSHLASLEEIKANEYNLNIPRYVNSFLEEETIDLDAVSEDLKTLEKKMNVSYDVIAKFCDELGIAKLR
jgi:type I restriction enzyme M protein